MRRYIWVIIGCFAVFCAASSMADEEYDPAVYPELSEKQAMENSVQQPTSMTQISISPTRNGSVIDTPKFVDDEDLNFENIDNAFDENTQAAEPVEIPMIQKPLAQITKNSEEDEEISQTEEKKEAEIKKAQTLTDTIKESGANEKSGETWINKLAGAAENKVSSEQNAKGVQSSSVQSTNLETMIEKSKKRNSRSNASVFDISGAMLRMTFKQIEDTLTRRGFRKSMQKMDIPNFIRWRNEDKCRAAGVVGYERLENCVIKIAQRDKHQYVERVAYTKYDTKETIEVRFTSNFTGNKAYRISYKSEAANITGNSQKAIYLRNIKVYDFWKKINQKYGAPDNRDDVIWSLGNNKPYLQAATGRLLLEDPMLSELDYTRMSREDQRYMNTDLYSF